MKLVRAVVLSQGEDAGSCLNIVSTVAVEMISEALSAPLISVGILRALAWLPLLLVDKVVRLPRLLPLVVVVKVAQVGAVIEWKPVAVRPDSE